MKPSESQAPAAERKPAHPATISQQKTVLQELDFSDRSDFEDAQHGFIATIPDARI